MLLVTAIVYFVIAMTWHDHTDPSGRAVDHAWNILVPRLLQHELRKPDAAFLAGLAEASRGRGDIEQREESLRQASAIMRKERIAIPYVSPLSILQINDAVQQGADDLLRIADEVSEVFQALTTLRPCRTLLKELRGDAVDRTRRARLRVLLLAPALLLGWKRKTCG